jgi:hypothetical protein
MSLHMKTILIAYPELFKCSSKFERKVNRILSTIDTYEIVYFSDKNSLIKNLFHQNQNYLELRKITNNVEQESITHAIIFNEGNSFVDLFRFLKKSSVATRDIKVETTKVVNKDRGEKYEIYIGRGTPWGNPYAVGFGNGPGEEANDREEAIRKYKFDFGQDFLKGRTEFKKNLLSLRGKILACHCKPLACHGDVLIDYLNSYDDGN